MFNEELYKNLEKVYGIERMIDFAEIMTTRYDILWNDNADDFLIEEDENDFERDWWFNKHVELKTSLEITGNNKNDEWKKNLINSLNCLDSLKHFLKEKGYKSLSEVLNCNDFNEEILREK